MFSREISCTGLRELGQVLQLIYKTTNRQMIEVPCSAMNGSGNVSWVAPVTSEIDSLGKLVHDDPPPAVSQAALSRLEALSFFDRRGP